MGPFQKALTSVSPFVKTWRYLQMAEKNREQLTQLKMEWAKDVLSIFNPKYVIRGEPSLERPAVFVGNHISYLDIPVMLGLVPDVSFVSKKEVKRWPFIGKGATLIDTIFVDRGSYKSRGQVREQLKASLAEGKKRMVVFPSGTTSVNEHLPWKKGSFVVAQEAGAPIQAFRLRYTPLRRVAYIDNDFLPTHLYSLVGVPEVQIELEFNKPVMVDDPIRQAAEFHEWSREWLVNKS